MFSKYLELFKLGNFKEIFIITNPTNFNYERAIQE